MKNKFFVGGLAFLLFLLPTFDSYTVFYPIEGNILYVGGSGPNNYSKIQDAINDAMPGDTIIVYPGLYIENLYIYKSLKIESKAGANFTIIRASFGNTFFTTDGW